MIAQGSPRHFGNIRIEIRTMKEKQSLEYYAKLPYTTIVEQWDDGKGPYWVARIAELPHCMIHADTPEEAVKEIEEVKRDWIMSNLRRGLQIPEPKTHGAASRPGLESPLRSTNSYLPGPKSKT